MTELYPDTRCPACGQPHTLSHRNTDRRAPRSVFSYVCPLTKVVVSFRPADNVRNEVAVVTNLALPRAGVPVALAPAEAVPMTWMAD